MIEVIAQATDQATQAAAQPGGITGSIQGGLGCLGAAIGVGIVGMKYFNVPCRFIMKNSS